MHFLPIVLGCIGITQVKADNAAPAMTPEDNNSCESTHPDIYRKAVQCLGNTRINDMSDTITDICKSCPDVASAVANLKGGCMINGYSLSTAIKGKSCDTLTSSPSSNASRPDARGNGTETTGSTGSNTTTSSANAQEPKTVPDTSSSSPNAQNQKSDDLRSSVDVARPLAFFTSLAIAFIVATL